jgi:hypothetical protein
LERKEYFDTLTANLNPEDFHLQLAAVVELAKNGKDLSGFHYDTIPLLTRWLKSAFEALDKARKQQPKTSSKYGPGKLPLGEGTNIEQLFRFTINVVKFSFNISDDTETESLIDQVIYIATHARDSGELRDCVRLLDSIVTYGSIPANKLKDFVTILCSIHFVVREVRAEAWHTIGNLCRSHNGHTTVKILLDVLRQPEKEKGIQSIVREIRGSLSVLEMIIAEDGENGYPLVPFTLLIEAMAEAMAVDHPKVENDILHLICSLFGSGPESLKANLLEEDWTTMFSIVTRCALRASETSDGGPAERGHQQLSPSLLPPANDRLSHVATGMAQMLYGFIIKIEQLLDAMPSNDFLQRESCISFFATVQAHLPESCAKLVIDYYTEFRFCYPSDANWERNIRKILDSFFTNRSRPTRVRLQALKAITDVYDMVEMIDAYNESGCNRNFIVGILNDVAEEKDILVLQEIIAFAVTVADIADPDAFEYIMKQLRNCLKNDRLNSPLFPHAVRPAAIPSSHHFFSTDGPSSALSPANVVTRGFIRIFMRSMDKFTTKALRTFDEILWIARNNSVETDARLSAMKMLFRLRADWANRIFLTPFTESEALASSFFRTPASLARKQAADEAQHTRVSRNEDSRSLRSTSVGQSYTNVSSARNASGVSRTLHRNHQMWMTPDPGALPEPTSEKASTLLASVVNIDSAVDGEVMASHESGRQALKINIWLETIIGLLQSGCDWEVYSYILVHLPSQLTNHTLFRGAIPQLKLLRSVVCEQIKNGSFHEPPISSGLRKADVAICYFQILTMVMSYHRHFSRSEEDEIVRCFIHGVGAWDRAAKCCIQALSICCHELPASMKNVLAGILLKMSQIITQSHVAVHILEFLAGLARLPDLYSNFREEEYRTVFGICFRYLQYVRDQNARSSSNRNSTASSRPVSTVSTSLDNGNPLFDIGRGDSNLLPNASDDLPQYVFALAYHVITFWFLSLRLSDRAGHVTWITKNLVWTDDAGRQHLDEQAEVTLDFMRRTAYADVDESRADPSFTEENYGEILKERWIIGQSIVTVEQATRSGWAQITKRQPSGTSHYMIRQKFEPPQAHQVVAADGVRDPRRLNTNFFLPSNIPVQLLAPTSESMRPIHLPKDSMIQRAISALDRTSTVDGHKVGIIYIGAGQTLEKEILPNVSGSTDYTDFISGLGTLTKLQGATFNTQGLDRQSNTDGEFTICWRDRVTELVFHITTMMPTNLEHDPQCIGKKRHIGNDFVNIVFNNSGTPFNFDTFPSEFNYTYIVITPESRASFLASRERSRLDADSAFYKVHVMSKDGFPEISPAAEPKILCLKALPDFIRLLALNASVFCQVWANRQGGEHVSSWRSRLRSITQLRDKYKHIASSTISPPGTSQGSTANAQETSMRNARDGFSTLRRASVANFLTNTNEHDRPIRHSINGDSDSEIRVEIEDGVVESVDFSRWA